MPLSRTEEILNIFANCTKNAKNNLETDIASVSIFHNFLSIYTVVIILLTG